MTVASFLEAFPEFTDVNTETPDLVSAKLAQAARRVASGTVAAFLRDDLIAYLAAHLLATSPQGQQARMVSKDGRTTYLEEYERLCRTVPTGPVAA
jgi:hypothetical protein